VDAPVEALRQVFRCLPFDDAFAVLESALRRGTITRPWVGAARLGRTRSEADLLTRADGIAESGTESLLKAGLVRRGVPFRQQVPVSGVGRVDFVVGDRLIVEVDSKTHHLDLSRDRRRDGDSSIAGFRTLRFMYGQVRFERDWVLRAIHAAYLRGDHR